MAANLAELYERPIDRRIDPVATVGELDPDYVQKEIDEYFFTDTLYKHLHTFLSRLVEGTEGRTGVWINGYYGSGKSHFLKYIFYCFSEQFGEAALSHFETSVSNYEGDPLDQPVTENDVRSVRKGLGDLTIDPVMFNIKNVSDEDKSDRSVTRTFYNRLNAHRGYNKSNIQIARFEKHLDEQGVLEDFKQEVREQTGDEWDEKADDLIDLMLSDVLEAAARVGEIDVESARAMLQKRARVSIEGFIEELRAYLETKPGSYRLVYLVDEVSQYMQGEPNLLVGLQTIVEEIGNKIGDKMWVVCTAQQELEELVETAKEKQLADYSYGKIISRFGTYLPLESQNADFITKKRVLSKNLEGKEVLRGFFKEHKQDLLNQFEIANSSHYRGFENEDEFVDTYPFIPYQFRLIVEVIRAFAKADFLVPGMAGTERSLIGLTHEVAQESKDESVGFFAPFDAFYNARLSDKLTHHARSIIANAMDLPSVKDDPFAQRVVKSLFLLSNIARDQSLQFPATAANLAFTLIDEVDPNRMELKRRTQDVLDRLFEANVVSESEGTYRFLQEEEIRVKSEINNQSITQRDRLGTVNEKVIQQELGWGSRVSIEGTNVSLYLKVDDYDVSSTGSAEVRFLLYRQDDPDELAIKAEPRVLAFCLNQNLGEDQKRLLDRAVRIDAYLQDNLDSASGDRLEAMHTFKDQRDRALADFKDWFLGAFKDATYISGGQKLKVSDQPSQDVGKLYDTVVQEHLGRVYSKRDLAIGYASDRTTLKQSAASRQTSTEQESTQAEAEVESYLSLAGNPTMEGVRQRYEKPPYGWRTTEMVDVLLRLEAENKWTFRWKSEEISREEFATKAVRKREQGAITIHKQEDVDPALMDDAIRAVNQTMFNTKMVDDIMDPKKLRNAVSRALQQKADEAESHAKDHRGRPFDTHFATLSDMLESAQRASSAADLFEQVVEEAERIQEQVELCTELTNFWGRHGESYQAMRDLVQNHEPNADALDAQTRSRLEKIASYVRNESRPHETFRTMADYYEAVQEAVDEKISTLQETAVKEYSAAFDVLQDRKEELGVEDVLPDREHKMNQLQRLSSLASLQTQIYQVSDFKADYLARLNEAVPSDPESDGEDEPPRPTEIFDLARQIERSEIQSEEDVEAFLESLRGKLLTHVRDGKLVILK